MKQTLHALMIGINRYPDPRHELRGCLNDLKDLKTYLKENFDQKKRQAQGHSSDGAQWSFRCKELLNDKADRQNIIDHFRHFEAAKDGDICLLYYSGHGSRAAAPKEFWHESPSRMLETMVCYDSRRGGRDLYDKELRYLIWNATKGKKIQFIAVMDCCHSGSITRGNEITDRMADANPIGAELKDYLGVETYQHLTKVDGAEEFSPPTADNLITLAASRDKESAKEMLIKGTARGVFTWSLVKTLRSSNGNLSYGELMNKVSLKVSNIVKDQSPQLEATNINDTENLFLNGAVKSSGPKCFVSHHPKNKWVVNKGAVHGMVASQKEEPTIIELEENGHQLKVTKVMTSYSKVEGADGLNVKKIYDAKIISQAVPRIIVAFAKGTNAKVKRAIKKLLPQNLSPYFELGTLSKADYHIKTIDNTLRLTRPNDDRPVFKRIKGYDRGCLITFLDRIDAVGKWQNVKDIANPNSTIKDNEIAIELQQITDYEDHENNDADKEKVDWQSRPVFRYELIDGQWMPPAFQLSIKNTGKRDLFVSALAMSADYEITNVLLPKETLPSAPSSPAFLRFKHDGKDYRNIVLQFADAFLTHGVTEISTFVKFFISTEEKGFDTNDYNQKGLKLDVNPALGQLKSSFGSPVKLAVKQADWITKEIELVIVRPMDSLTMKKNETVKLSGLKIKGHKGFSAKVKLNQTAETTRGVGVPPPHVVASLNNMHPYEFVEGQANAPGLSVVEFSDADGAESINADNPLVMQLDQNLPEGETILPIGYDPETGLYYPLGAMSEEGDIVIEDMPEETPSGERSLKGSIKIFFQKIVLSKLGIGYEYPLLQMATVDENEQLIYESDKKKIEAAVKKAKSVAMFIHGIIGDTEEMTKAVQRAKNGAGTSINTKYDLVLTFDYENLSTSIKQTGKDLKDRLSGVGLSPNHGKTFHIIAHSMGGLVSRWFIEKEKGNEVVNQLIQLGTPNGGSEWASVQELATTLLARAINGASFLQPWLVPLSIAGRYAKKAFTTLQEMHVEESKILKQLNDGSDPGIPYTIIAGNTSLIPVEYQEREKKLFKRLLSRFKQRGHYDALDLALFKSPNDIAVRVDSITGIEGKAKRQFVPEVKEVACDHISYFADKEGLMALAAVVFES